MFSKKFLSKLMVAALSAAFVLPVNTFATTQFTDVSSLDGAYTTAINFMNGLGIMVGSTDKADDTKTKFGPEEKVTRAQVAKIIDLALGYGKVVEAANVNSIKFPDVDKKGWAAKYIATATERGFIKGSTSGKFSPEGEVTYAQYATMVVRALGYEDSDLVGTWPLNYLTKATDLGVFNSLKEVAYDQPALRKDIAVMTRNMLYTPTKDDAENDKFVYVGQSTVTNSNAFQDKRPRWLIDDVKSKIGVAEATGAVIVDKSIDSNYSDKVKISTNVYNLQDTNTQADFTFAIPDGDKSRYTLGSKVNFWYSTNIGNRNTIIYDANSDATPKVDATVTANGASTSIAGCASVTTKVKPTDGNETAATYTLESNTAPPTFSVTTQDTLFVLNGKAWGKYSAIKYSDAKIGAVLQNAKVKMYDEDGDGNIDFVVANNEVRPQVVQKDFASTDTAIKVYDAWTTDSDDDTSISVDAAKVKVTGDVTKLTDIKANDVVYITKAYDSATSSMVVTNVDVKRQVVDGVITTVNYANNKPSSIVVSGTTYDFDSNVPNVDATKLVQNARVKFIVGKVTADSVNAKFVRYADYTSSGFDLANYGIVTSVVTYPLASPTPTFGIVTMSTLTGGVKTFNTDGLSAAGYATYVNNDKIYKYSYANGVLNLTPAAPAGTPAELSQSFYTGNVTGNTRAFGIMEDSTPAHNRSIYDLGILSATDLTNRVAAVSGSVYSITDTNSTLWNGYQYVGGYKAVVFKVTSTPTSYNFVSEKGIKAGTVSLGTTVVNGVVINADVYSIIVNGASKNILVNNGLTVPDYFNGYYVGANGIVYGFDTLTAVKSTGIVWPVISGQVNIGGTVYDVAPGTQLYVDGVWKDMTTFNNTLLPLTGTVEYIIAPTALYGVGPSTHGYVYMIKVVTE